MSEKIPNAQSRSARHLPIAGWLRGYPRSWLRFDLIAGLTTSAVVIPKVMAYAAIAGLPIEVGLYTALIPLVIYALLGSSRPLSSSTTSTIAILVAAQLAVVAADGSPTDLIVASSTLALLVGAFLLLAGILRLGFLAYFISDPVLTGFKAGIGLVIIVDQIPKMLGVHLAKESFFHHILSIFRHVPDASVPTVLLAAITLALMFGMERFLRRIPAPLCAVVLGIAASALLGLKQAGVELAGSIPPGLPSPSLPDLALIGKLWPGALGIALMAFTESIAAGRAFVKHGEPQPDANRELIALGAANLAGSFFRIMPSGGGTSQTAVNDKAGARTQMAQIVTAVTVLAVLLLLSPVISMMPQATLASVVVVTTLGLIRPAEFRAISKVRKIELSWALAACAGVVILGTLNGILVAVGISLITLTYIANHPPLYALGRKPGTDIFRPRSADHPEDETFPGLLIVRSEGAMTFASAPRLRDGLKDLVGEAKPRVLLLDMSAVPIIEYTALKLFMNLEERTHETGVTLWVAGWNPRVFDIVKRSPFFAALGSERMFHNVEQAVETYLRKTASGK